MSLSAKLNPIWAGMPVHQSLESQLEWLYQREPFFRLRFDRVGVSLPGWMESQLDKTIEAFSQDIDTRKAVGASLWLKSFTAHLFTGMAALRLKFKRVPTPSLDQITLDVAENGKLKQVGISASSAFLCLPDDPLAQSSLAMVVKSEEDLDQAFAELVRQIGGKLAPYFKEQKVNTPQFWGGIGYAVGLVFQKLTQNGCDKELIEMLQPTADAWLASILPDYADLNSVKSASQGAVSIYYIRRETCCLKYKLDGKKNCATCQQRDPVEQLSLYQSKVPA